VNQTDAQIEPGRWTDGTLPANVTIGHGSVVSGEHAFKRFRATKDGALRLGRCATLDGVHFAVGPDGSVQVGDWCYLTNVVLLCDASIKIGNYVRIGWNTTIADTDFHPIDPARRVDDAIACSPLADGRARPAIACAGVDIGDDVYIGPQATILKGVRIGAGAFVEPGAVVTRDVPPGARVMGNPAQVVAEVSPG
jgi:acetyltransferase-like isoleucine patch superfamily enzyme